MDPSSPEFSGPIGSTKVHSVFGSIKVHETLNFKGQWKFSHFDKTNPSAFNNDMLIFSAVLSVASIVSETVKGIRSIQSIWKRLNKKKNQPEIPLEEVKFSMIAERTESSELPPKNLDKTMGGIC